MPGSVLYLYPTDRLREIKSSISFRKGPVKVGSAKMDHLLKVQGAFRQPFHVHLEVHGGGIRVQMSDDIGDDRERGILLQKDACHSMAEAVHPPVLAAHRDVGFYHICPYQLVKMVPIGKRKERGHMADKDTAAVNLRPPIFQVIDHCQPTSGTSGSSMGCPVFDWVKQSFFSVQLKFSKHRFLMSVQRRPKRHAIRMMA